MKELGTKLGEIQSFNEEMIKQHSDNVENSIVKAIHLIEEEYDILWKEHRELNKRLGEINQRLRNLEEAKENLYWMVEDEEN